MGQMTYGILLGVPDFPGSESIIEEWEQINKDEIRKSPHGYWQGRAEIVPDFEGDNPTLGVFVGFWIAAGASGKDGVDDLIGFPLDDFSQYGKAAEIANKRWKRFAEWLASKGIATPNPKLYLLQTEVA